ncbi:hypothetical protein U9M48_001826 [Paspalum notatum var. saurae]|uniref:Uncharacterized protein n=1 Tax=Paspalum notatum var. saurae TaxID=547442 RepID=A0AAQ3PIN3_PASNO
MAGAEDRIAWTTKTSEALCIKMKQEKGGGASPREAEKGTAADSVSVAAAAASGAVEGDTPCDPWVPVAGLPTMILPQEYIDWIFSRKPMALEEDPDEYYNRMINDPEMVAIFTREYIEEERQILRDMAAANQLVADTNERFKAFARPQLLENGYVEVNAAHMAQRVRNWEILFCGLKLDDQDPGAGAGAVAVESN